MSLLARRRAMMGTKESLPDQPIGVSLVTKFYSGYRVDPETGALFAESNAKSTDFVPVFKGRTYEIHKTNNRVGGHARYTDADYTTFVTYITYGKFTTNWTLIQTENYYIRATQGGSQVNLDIIRTA